MKGTECITVVQPSALGSQRFVSAWESVADFVRLRSRISCAVNFPPQTLQRQPGDAAGATIEPGC